MWDLDSVSSKCARRDIRPDWIATGLGFFLASKDDLMIDTRRGLASMDASEE